MNAVGLAHRLGVGVAVAVVIAKGSFFIDVHIVYVGHTTGQTAIQQGGNVGLAVFPLCGHHGKCLVVGIKTGVQNGNNGAGAVIAQGVGLVRAHHAGGAAHGNGVLLFGKGGGQAVLLGHKDALYPGNLPGLRDIPIGHFHGKPIEHRGVSILQIGSAVDRLGGNHAANGLNLRLDLRLAPADILLHGLAASRGSKGRNVAGRHIQQRLVFQLNDYRNHIAVAKLGAFHGQGLIPSVGKQALFRLKGNFLTGGGKRVLLSPLGHNPVFRRRSGGDKAGQYQRQDQ